MTEGSAADKHADVKVGTGETRVVQWWWWWWWWSRDGGDGGGGGGCWVAAMLVLVCARVCARVCVSVYACARSRTNAFFFRVVMARARVCVCVGGCACAWRSARTTVCRPHLERRLTLCAVLCRACAAWCSGVCSHSQVGQRVVSFGGEDVTQCDTADFMVHLMRCQSGHMLLGLDNDDTLFTAAEAYRKEQRRAAITVC